MKAKIKHDVPISNENYQRGVTTIELDDGTKIIGGWEATGGMGQGCDVQINTTNVDEDEALALMEAVEEITVRGDEEVPESWMETGEWEGTVDWDEFRAWAEEEGFDGAGR